MLTKHLGSGVSWRYAVFCGGVALERLNLAKAARYEHGTVILVAVVKVLPRCPVVARRTSASSWEFLAG